MKDSKIERKNDVEGERKSEEGKEKYGMIKREKS